MLSRLKVAPSFLWIWILLHYWKTTNFPVLNYLVFLYHIVPLSFCNFRHDSQEQLCDLLHVLLERCQHIGHTDSITVISPAVIVRRHGNGCIAQPCLLRQDHLANEDIRYCINYTKEVILKFQF